ncbi:MAG TPA: EAL domain-containing protein [Xanthobacteraceae bacterium]|jgi:diguanylate cyclase (GGDEF)-like protein/PAS domain S-box-containing protein|nr:EAL domain-containing protein [Xanthobacteraceae bacterium]
MLRRQLSSIGIGLVTRWRRAVMRAASLLMTIRGRILVAFLVMSVITAGLGAYAALGIRNAGVLVDKTFDESLMSINYARAAAADFAAMRAAFARRWIANDAETRTALTQDLETFATSLAEDLKIAGERSQSARAMRAAENVQNAVNNWRKICERLLAGDERDVNWDTLDHYAGKADDQIDLLVNYTAGDGFLYRQAARAAVARDQQFNVAGTLLALVLSALVAWALARRIVGPVAVASNVAERIAAGKLDVAIPRSGTDELGALLAAMGVMRDNIKAMMDREVEQRRSAQARLADALESSPEGVVVVDSDDSIVLANAQAADLLGVAPRLLKPGTSLAQLEPALQGSSDAEHVLMRCDRDLHATREALMADGRWLRISRSPTRDQGFIFLCSDISRLKQQESSLRQSNMLLDAALENMSQGLCLYDAQNRLEIFNRRFLEIFRLPPERIKSGISYKEVLEISVPLNNGATRSVDQLLAEHVGFLREKAFGPHLYDLYDGRVVSCLYSVTADGRWVATYEDVTERRQAEAKIIHMARHDALTNLPNRVLFKDKMEQALARGDELAVMFLDLDRFKGVNDSLGHPVGDALLCAVTERLQRVVPGADTVARLGGDEFAVVQSNSSPNDTRDLAARIIDTMIEPFEVHGHQVVIGTSIGIAIAPADGNEPDQLLRNADMALYRAKADGRGTYHFFQPEMDAQMQERRTLELDLRKALLAEEFELYYQPLVDAGTGKVTGFEALLRWNHPERGLVSPDDFIPVAEEIGLIVPLGDWVLKQACREAMTWPGKLTVAVNLSAVQFRNPALALSVVSALGQSGLAASRLELEITESVLLLDDRSVLDALHQFRDLGARICMDDFGTGYSSLSYLRSFPFDKIKIDRSFICELGKESDAVSIIRAVIDLGSSLGMITTAEGVETEEQLDIVRSEGCMQVQGYLFSRPVPAAQLPALLQKLNGRTRAA